MNCCRFTVSPTLLLLPGLDGSGTLFKPLLELLPNHIKTKIAPIPTDLLGDHQQIAQQLLAELPEQNYVILAESFSGRTAYELCRIAPDKFIYVIFVASFVNKPSRLLSLFRLLPLSKLSKNQFIMHRIAPFLLGSGHPKQLSTTLYKALLSVPDRCFNNRLAILHKLKQPAKSLDVPCLIITAKQDLLLNHRAQRSIKKVFNYHAEQIIDGPHFLLQTRAKHCAQILVTLYAGLADIRVPTPAQKIDMTTYF